MAGFVRDWLSFFRLLRGFGRLLRAARRFGRAERLKRKGAFSEAFTALSEGMQHLRLARPGPISSGLMVVGAGLLEEVSRGLGNPQAARQALEEAVAVMAAQRQALSAVSDAETVFRTPAFDSYERWFNHRLERLRRARPD